MPSSSTTSNKAKGGWIGIDLGTSNCTAAVWDLSRSRCKVLRLGHGNLARPPPDGGSSRKGGKIVPSAVLFHATNKDEEDDTHGNDNEISGKSSCSILGHGVSTSVGYAAIQSLTTTDNASIDIDDKEGSESFEDQSSRALITSFKRVVGMTSRQARELKESDPEFWNSLPFHSVILDTSSDEGHEEYGQKTSADSLNGESFDVLGDTSTGASNNAQSTKNDQASTTHGIKEGVAISIQPLISNNTTSNTPSEKLLVTPLQVTTTLLQSIRIAASDYLTNHNKPNIQPPGHDSDNTAQVLNCIIGVPAHYSHAQRSAIQNAAKNAGFTGHVGVMTESTAASMAYGLFVSPNKNKESDGSSGASMRDGSVGGKNILVFDMGGGTTDVTIASIDFGKESDDSVQFRVLATAGDRCLGGDNVDELLARYLWKKLHTQSSTTSSAAERSKWVASEHQEFIRQCRRAKEELCGNDKAGKHEVVAVLETHVTLGGDTVTITRQEFDSATQPLIERAEQVVADALNTLQSNEQTSMIHEVVLVGGSTHIPTIRTMLRQRFPPPIPPELCTSISAETAVAQGLAIQAALISGAVPLWELRNAMMLDVLPHTLGVWVGAGHASNKGGAAGKTAPFDKGQIIEPSRNASSMGHFVPILLKDDPLPALGNATFTLASKGQLGVSIIAVEHIGPGEVYQCMGVFDFLLHRLAENDVNNGDTSVRDVKIGMKLEESGEFTVSIFDEKDPEHREKRRKYLKEKEANNDDSIQKEGIESLLYESDDKRQACSGTEIGLIFFCIIIFALYVAARIAFSDIDMESYGMEAEL